MKKLQMYDMRYLQFSHQLQGELHKTFKSGFTEEMVWRCK